MLRAHLVAKKESLLRVIGFGMNPRIRVDVDSASGEAFQNNALYEHFLMVFILNCYTTNLSKSLRNFETRLVVCLVLIAPHFPCIRLDSHLLHSTFDSIPFFK